LSLKERERRLGMAVEGNFQRKGEEKGKEGERKRLKKIF